MSICSAVSRNSEVARATPTPGSPGNPRSDLESLRGWRWRMIYPPTHLHYFSLATLSKLLDRNGFDVVHVSHPGNSRGLRSVLYFILALQMKRPEIYAMLQSWRILDLRLMVNLFDIMYVVGRRRHRDG